MLVLALPPILLSIGIVGLQLIGASSDGAYTVQLLLYASLLAALFLAAPRKRMSLHLLYAVGGAAVAALMPFEVLIYALESAGRQSSTVLPGEAYPDPKGTVPYWSAVFSLFIIHGALIAAAGLLVRRSMQSAPAERTSAS